MARKLLSLSVPKLNLIIRWIASYRKIRCWWREMLGRMTALTVWLAVCLMKAWSWATGLVSWKTFRRWQSWKIQSILRRCLRLDSLLTIQGLLSSGKSWNNFIMVALNRQNQTSKDISTLRLLLLAWHSTCSFAESISSQSKNIFVSFWHSNKAQLLQKLFKKRRLSWNWTRSWLLLPF